MNRVLSTVSVGLLCGALGCAPSVRTPLHVAEDGLRLQRVVLYQNGVGYFERAGEVDGDLLRIRVRKDQVNDLLKSLTVVDRRSGKALSVSMPLDPADLGRAAHAALSGGSGGLSAVLDGLRGVSVAVQTKQRELSGRVAMVESLPVPRRKQGPPPTPDYELVLLDGAELSRVRLSAIRSLRLGDGEVVMQLHRRLDAAAGEGMFQQVELALRLGGKDPHDLVVSYVAAAPRWKPTYRLVLDGEDSALLQAWAVVDNVSGENWNDVALSLTAGAPLAFRYDLHSPTHVERPDLTDSGAHKQARVAVGESPVATMAVAPAAPPAPSAKKSLARPSPSRTAGAMATRERSMMAEGADGVEDAADEAFALAEEAEMSAGFSAPAPMNEAAALEASMQTRVTSQAVAGMTRFDLGDPVTLPDGTATMVALINERVPGEEAFLFRPGGSGAGYEHNPYRVARFRNATPFALEPGPISVYAGGSFVGEGLSEAVASDGMAVIPFAVEPGIAVHQQVEDADAEQRLVRVSGGVFEVESHRRHATTWTVTAAPRGTAYRVLVRHPRRGGAYTLVDPPAGTETLADAYLVPVPVAADGVKASVKVVEQTPSRMSLSIWDGRLLPLFDTWLAGQSLTPEQRAALEPLVKLRRELARIDTEVEGLGRQQAELDQRAQQTRMSLEALKKDPKASALRTKLGKRLSEFVEAGDAIGRQRVTLESRRLELKIELEDRVQALKL